LGGALERRVTRVGLGFHFVEVFGGVRHFIISLGYASIYDDGIAWIYACRRQLFLTLLSPMVMLLDLSK
jgi:hypothetical protein